MVPRVNHSPHQSIRRKLIMFEQKVVVIPEGKICDYIDGTFRNDTPEEYVRQTIEKGLIRYVFYRN